MTNLINAITFDFFKNQINKNIGITKPKIFTLCIIGLLYMYFANSFLSHIIGLLYPMYRIYRNPDADMKSLIQYIFVYGHINLLLSIITIFSNHFQIICVPLLIYITEYHVTVLENIYQQTRCYDKIGIVVLTNWWQSISCEWRRILTQQKID
jgi:hypothetical protein